MDPGCYMGMANAMSYYVTPDALRQPQGIQLAITCLALPGSGRVTITGQAQVEYGSSCRDAIYWLSQAGGQGIEKMGMGTPRFDPSTLGTDYDVGRGAERS